MTKRKILILLDSDAQPNSFDCVVALDAGVDELLPYGQVALDQVQSLVHGAIFTRGVDDLQRTAIFVCGSDVTLGEQMLERIRASFLGSLSVSVMLDANGANTTAAAAVLAARSHLSLSQSTAMVLAGTGPVGQRAARLLVRQGSKVRLASRSQQRAAAAAARIEKATGTAVEPCSTSDDKSLREGLDGVHLVIAAGAPGVELLPKVVRDATDTLKVAIDLNAVPPQGIEGVQMTDKAAEQGQTRVYGAVGIGGLKMKIHRAAVKSLFESNDRVLDAEQIYELGESM